MTLTNRQADVLQFIRDMIVNNQCTPTVREICERFDIQSPNGVVCHLKALEKKGMIKRLPGEARNIRLLGVTIIVKDEEVA